ncbi:MAG: hypothetical protein AAGD13_10085 [Pseudomonadota bacterium]
MSSRKNTSLNGAILGGLACVLAACAEGETPPAASSSGSQASSQQTASAPQQQAAAGRVALSSCQTPDNGKVFFKVGASNLSLDPSEIQETIPRGLKRPFTAEDLKAELDRQTAAGGGCPEKPLDLLVLGIRVPNETSLLNGQIGLLATNPTQLSQDYANFTAQLQSSPPQTCQTTDGALLICPGKQKIGNQDVEVAYIVTTDRSKRLRSGGPLAVRCGRQGGNIGNCRLIDLDSSGTAFEAGLKNGPYSTATLDEAWRSAQTALDQRRR